MALAIPLIVTNHVWHNILTAYVAIVFLVFCLRALNTDRMPAPVIDYLMVGLTAGLVLFSKQNAGLPLLLMTGALCAYRYLFRQDRAAGLTFIAIAVGVVIVGLSLFSLFARDIAAMTYPFTAVSGRIIPDSAMFRATMSNPPFLLIELAAIAILIGLVRDHRSLQIRGPAFAPCAGFVAVGLFAFITNWDVKYNDLALILVPGLMILGYSEGAAVDAVSDAGVNRMTRVFAAVISVLRGGWAKLHIVISGYSA